MRSDPKGAEVWAKLEQKFLGSNKEYLLQDAKALEVWLWRYMLQRRFLRKQDLQDVRVPMEDVCILLRVVCCRRLCIIKEIPAVDTLLTTIEKCQDMNIQYLRVRFLLRSPN
jgi:hypothetical protein